MNFIIVLNWLYKFRLLLFVGQFELLPIRLQFASTTSGFPFLFLSNFFTTSCYSKISPFTCAGIPGRLCLSPMSKCSAPLCHGHCGCIKAMCICQIPCCVFTALLEVCAEKGFALLSVPNTAFLPSCGIELPSLPATLLGATYGKGNHQCILTFTRGAESVDLRRTSQLKYMVFQCCTG